MSFSPLSSAASSSVSDPPQLWHTLDIEQALERLESDPDRGLTPAQITQRQQQYGLNELTETGGRSPLAILWDQFTNIMLVMLIAVAIVSAVLDLGNEVFPKDAIAIRSHTQLTVQLNPFSNPYVLSAVTLTTALQLMLIYVAPLRDFFGTHWLSPLELLICIGFSALMFVWIELEKLVINWFRIRQTAIG